MHNFLIGQKYRRRDVYRVIGVPEDTKGGNWDTGYARLNNDWFIFCNVDVPGRTGHDYPNAWVGDDLQWFGKTTSHKRQPSIQHMTGETGKTYVFWRNDDQSPFTFAGCGRALSVEDATPVKVLWSFDRAVE
jgi:5-methylcytosine-specific restriction protein A